MPKVNSHMYTHIHMHMHTHTHTPKHSSKLFYLISIFYVRSWGGAAGWTVHLGYGRAKLVAGTDTCVPMMALTLMYSASWHFWTFLRIISCLPGLILHMAWASHCRLPLGSGFPFMMAGFQEPGMVKSPVQKLCDVAFILGQKKRQ